ncbi:MAG TPA: AI-2E family transporter [Pirellulales bacterium]|nr:AI-2E family transporter [Pirellulales bacterium]
MKHDSSATDELSTGWLPRERALAMVLVGATVLSVYLCWLLVAPFVSAIAFAVALALVSYPVFDWLRLRVHSPNLAAAITVALVALMLVAPTVVLGRQLYFQAPEGVRFLNEKIREIPWEEKMKEYPRFAPVVEWFERSINPANELNRLAGTATTQASWVLGGSFSFATQLLMMLYILFYFIRDHRQGVELLRSLVPLSNPETDEVFARVEDTINATIYGTVIVGLVQGLVAWILYLVLGLPAPLLWGTLTAVMAIVPVLGPSIVWVPAALFLALQGAYVKTGLITVGGIAVGLIGHFLYPILVGHKLRLHPVLVFFAFIGGIYVFNIAGLIIGPAVLALTEALVNVWQHRTADGRPAERRGDAQRQPVKS